MQFYSQGSQKGKCHEQDYQEIKREKKDLREY